MSSPELSTTAPATPAFGAQLSDVSVRYSRRGEPALRGLDLTIRPGVITGLLGRNGAGKTTLAAVLAGFRRATSGQVRVGPESDLQDPFENAWIASHTQLIREHGDVWNSEPLKDTLSTYEALRPHWDADLAARLLETFEISTTDTPGELSRGQRSAIGVTVGLASRAPLTILDEVYLGMDAANRYAFYDALLEDYAAHPRTIVLSTHLIEEVERLFEDVVIIDQGSVLLAESADDLGELGLTVTGAKDPIDQLVGIIGYDPDTRVLSRKDLGPTSQITVFGGLDQGALDTVEVAGLEVGSVPIQDLFVHLTRPTGAKTPDTDSSTDSPVDSTSPEEK